MKLFFIFIPILFPFVPNITLSSTILPIRVEIRAGERMKRKIVVSAIGKNLENNEKGKKKINKMSKII